jgi:hypothetical protein
VDEISFNPDPQEAIHGRKLSIAPKELQDFSWNGDVFKAIALIHDFIQMLNTLLFGITLHKLKLCFGAHQTKSQNLTIATYLLFLI